MAEATNTQNPSVLHPFTSLVEARQRLSRALGGVKDDDLHELGHLAAAFYEFATLYHESEGSSLSKAVMHFAYRLDQVDKQLTYWHDEVMPVARIVCDNDLEALMKWDAYLESVGAKRRAGGEG